MNVAIINEFLTTWKEKATIYYTNLANEYRTLRNTKFEINAENLMKCKDFNGKRIYTDEKIIEILADTNEYRRAGISTNNLTANIKHSFVTKFENENTKSDLAIINNIENLEKILNKEMEAKRENFISKIEKIAGENITECNLNIGLDGNINGTVKGELGKCKVETILASGFVQCAHFRVLVKKVK